MCDSHFYTKNMLFWIYFYLFLCTVRGCQKIYKFFSFGIFGTQKKEAIKKIIGTLQTRSVLRLFSHPLFIPPSSVLQHVSFIVMSLKCTFYPFFLLFPSYSLPFSIVETILVSPYYIQIVICWTFIIQSEFETSNNNVVDSLIGRTWTKTKIKLHTLLSTTFFSFARCFAMVY